MTTAYLKLHFRTQRFDLNDGLRCAAADTFTPPSPGSNERTYTFSVHLIGDNYAEHLKTVEEVQNFLDLAARGTEHLRLGYKASNTIPFQPVIGTLSRISEFVIVPAYYPHENTAVIQEDWSLGASKDQPVFDMLITLRIRPWAEMPAQRVPYAEGSVYSNFMGAGGLADYGLRVPDAETNLFINPFFGQSADWDFNYTASTRVIATREQDGDFVMYGDSAALLHDDRTGGQLRFTQSINANSTATHIIAFFAKRKNLSEVDSNICSVFHDGSTITTNYEALQNGWYLVWGKVTGVVGAVDVGLVIAAGASVVVDGFLFCARDTLTMPFSGDMQGCSWSGGAHTTTSVRSVSKLEYNTSDVLKAAEGSITLALRHTKEYSDLTAGVFAWDAGPLQLSWNFGVGKFRLQDGAQTVDSIAAAPSFGDVSIITCTWGSDGLALYYNTESPVTNATYEGTALHASLHVGYNQSDLNHMDDDISALLIYAEQLTAAQVAELHAEIEALTDNGATKADAFAVMWSDASGWVFDNENAGDNEDSGIMMNVPGDMSAQLRMLATPAPGTYETGDNWCCIISNTQVMPRHFFNGDVFNEDSPIIVGIASGSGRTISTKGIDARKVSFFLRNVGNVTGYEVWGAVSLTGAHERGNELRTKSKKIDFHATIERIFHLGSVEVAPYDVHEDGGNSDEFFAFIYFNGVASLGASGNMLFVLGQCAYIRNLFLTEDDRPFSILPKISHGLVSGDERYNYEYTGDEITPFPNDYNVIRFIQGNHGQRSNPTATVTVDDLLIVPRFRTL